MSNNNIDADRSDAAARGTDGAAAGPRQAGNGRGHAIGSERQALDVARRVATSIRASAARREHEGDIPFDEMELISSSGLSALSAPRAYGGPEISTVTLVEVVKILAAVEPGVAQILVPQFNFTEFIIAHGNERQRSFFLPRIANGARVANALSEAGTKTAMDLKTRLTKRNGGGFVLNGEKFYSTGSYTSRWFAVMALDEVGRTVFAYVSPKAPGVRVDNDWFGIGQRKSLSGTSIFKDVEVPEDFVFYVEGDRVLPTAGNTHAQILHAAVDTGIAAGALEETLEFLNKHARPWVESGVDRPGVEPLIINKVGELEVLLHSAEALLRRAAEFIDVLRRDPASQQAQTDAILAVADARVQSDKAALTIGTDLFALLGTRSALEKWNLDRFWRNARTHTLHDPIRWKLHHIGNYYANGVHPPDFGRPEARKH
jgi:SfnB family sulfur acquisition oxidoreductase